MNIIQLYEEKENQDCFEFLENKIREASQQMIERIYSEEVLDFLNVAMAFKLCQQAEKNWRRLKGFEKLDLVAKNIEFENGVLKIAA